MTSTPNVTYRFQTYTSAVAVEPLTLTRNFGWVVAFCVTALVVAPLFIGWAASVFLN